jgi:structural maintenance of chromosome 1
VKLAIDLLEFDERVEKAMWYACGDTLVTDTLAQAKELAYNRKDIRVKVVAKDGTLISKSGILTGGDPSIFDRKLRRWQANDTDKLSKEYEKNYNEWQATKSMIEKLQKDMSE